MYLTIIWNYSENIKLLVGGTYNKITNDFNDFLMNLENK